MAENYGSTQVSVGGFDPSGPISTIIGLGGNFALSAYNNAQARALAEYDRQQNYLYGEMAANNADTRTRGLYRSFYSPEALLKQYQEAGLSPSMMFGGTPGQGGMSGAQGNGAHVQTPYQPVSLLEAAQVSNLLAQTKKTNAETTNIHSDTDLKEIQKEFNSLAYKLFEVDTEAATTYIYDEEGKPVESFYDVASRSENYDKFQENLFKVCNNEKTKQYLKTERGQEFLRNIFKTSREIGRDLAVFGKEEVEATFAQQIIDFLKEKGGAELSAESLASELKSSISTNTLTAQQNEAWVHLLDWIEQQGGEGMKDTSVIMYYILQAYINNRMQAAGIAAKFL